MLTRRASLPGLTLLFVLLSMAVVSPATITAQGHAPAPAAAPQHDAPASAQPTAKGAQPVEHAPAEEAHGSEHAVRDTIARLLNFGILVGALVYFLKAPIGTYLAGRSTQIRQDLVAAAELRRTATAQLEQIQQKLGALPAELAALKARGEEDVQAEKIRMAQAAAAERERLVEQTRREIDMRLRLARRELTEYAAQLAVAVAQERITRTITPDDQLRLVDRYATQLKEAR
jgi:F0F1-type ATP synthase membrane subunit b/b'